MLGLAPGCKKLLGPRRQTGGGRSVATSVTVMTGVFTLRAGGDAILEKPFALLVSARHW